MQRSPLRTRLLAVRRVRRDRLGLLTTLAVCYAFNGCSGGGSGPSTPPATQQLAPGARNSKPQVVEQGTGTQIIQFPDATTSAGGTQQILVSGGKLWFTDGTLGVANVTTSGVFTRYSSVFTAGGNGLIVGPDKNIWFAGNGFSIGTVTSTDSVVEFSIPIPSTSSIANPVLPCVGWLASTPADTTGVWFTDFCNDAIGRISTNGSTTVEYPEPTYGDPPSSIVAGSGKNLWFLEGQPQQFASISTSGVINEYPIPYGAGATGPIVSIAGSLWFPYVSNPVGYYGLFSFKTPTSFQVAQSTVPGCCFHDTALGPDGNLWMSDDNGGDYLTSMTPSGTYVSRTPINAPAKFLVTGPDKNIWFTSGNTIGVNVLNPQTVTATSIAFNMVGEAQTFSASEGGSGTTLTVTSSNSKVASVAPGAYLGTWTVTAVGGGSCVIKVADQSGNYTNVSVSVTTESFVVQ